nr:MAG TPA_asm: RNA polymerase subunit [Caudoviricetes sp.]
MALCPHCRQVLRICGCERYRKSIKFKPLGVNPWGFFTLY